MNFEQALDIAKRISSGALVLPPEQLKAASEAFHCNANYEIEGWRFVVFSDGREFDYFDSITAPDGERVEFTDLPDELKWYRPPSESDDARWGLR